MSTPYRVPILDTFDWQESVKSRATTPPGAPAKGDRYIVIAIAGGAWAGQENKIAFCSNATGPVWTFVTPTAGWNTYVVDEGAYYYWNTVSWGLVNNSSIDEMYIEVMG